MKTFEYMPLMRLGVPTKDGRLLSAAGVWRVRTPCPLLRAESREGHCLAMGVMDGMSFSSSSDLVYASGSAEPEIVAGLLLRELVLVPEFVTWGRKVERRDDLFMWLEGEIAAVHVRGKEDWPWA